MPISRIIQIFASLLCLPILWSCSSKDDEPSAYTGSIYGAVTDFTTGEPIANANVSLRPGGETTLTGSDGIYEFLNVADGNYSVVVTKADYIDQIDDYIIQVSDGRRMRRDVTIRKKMTDLMITNVNGSAISELNFGSDPYITVKAFNIFNNGTEKLQCSLSYSCNWIKSLSSTSEALSPGRNVTISIEIDRQKLSRGVNETPLYITSASRSNMLKIIAVQNTSEVAPNVVTLPVTYSDGTINAWCDTFHGSVLAEGNPPYTARGFCFSSTNKTPTIDDNRINVGGTGLGEFSYTYRNFPPTTTRYYVRAWVMYGPDNKVQYGDTQTFVYNDVL